MSDKDDLMQEAIDWHRRDRQKRLAVRTVIATNRAARIIAAAPEMYKLLLELEDNQMRAAGADYKHRLWKLLNHIREVK